MKKMYFTVVASLLLLAAPCWGTIYDYSVNGTFLDRNQISGSISGNVWIDDANISTRSDQISYDIPYFTLIFQYTSSNFSKTGTEGSIRLQFWGPSNPNAGYRNYNDTFMLSDGADVFATAAILTNTGNFITDFLTIPTFFSLPSGGFNQFMTPAPGIQRMSMDLTQVAVVPEPSTLIFLGFGLMGLASIRKMLKN